jgi:hypothetical protein
MASKISVHPNQTVTQGYGEYIVYHQDKSGKIIEPSRETFETTYSVLSHFNSPKFDNRYEQISERIKKIDPTLRITFIPRTYYELQLIKKAIKEDLSRKEYCPNEKTPPNPYFPNNTKDCWHISHFGQEEDNQAEAVKVLAFNLNQNLVKKLIKCPLENSSLKFSTITRLCEKQIQFFKNFAAMQISQLGFKGSYFSEGPLVRKFSSGSMSIASDQDAQIVLNAETLECSKIAEKAHLLYRGTDFPTDLPYSPQNDQHPYSFSFGSGLFAGAFYRQGATPFVYVKDSKDGYVMAVPDKDLSHAPIFIPNKHPICQLTSENGVTFHPRTQVWRTNLEVYGFASYGTVKRIVEPFFSEMDRESLTDEVLKYKHNNVIFLKSDKASPMTTPTAFQNTVHIYCKTPPGRSLYIRGNDQGGLTWQKGQPMIQVDEDHWTYRIPSAINQLVYKILIDDVVWSEGADFKLGDSEKESSEIAVFKAPSQPSPGRATRLTVKLNTGNASTLMICGGGGGLNWNKPTPLKKSGDDIWTWETFEPFDSVEFKLLINGQWETGPNHRLKHGKKIEVIPRF